MGPDDLVLCAGSLPRASFRERVAAAVAGGFRGISVWARQHERERAAGTTDATMRALLADHGLAVAEVDALSDVLFDPTTTREPGSRERACHDIAAALGARSLSLVEGPGRHGDVARAADAFAAVCDRAAPLGLLVHLEPWPGSRLDLDAAVAVVRAAARPNGGLLADSWHLARGGDWTARLDAAVGVPVVAVQMSDGPLAQSGEYLDETMHRRRVPGDGEFDLTGFIRLLDRHRSRAPIGVEVLSDALASLPAAEVGRRLGDAARAVLARAREAR
jgi:sugar phosphate isomerase/epimerase